MAHSAKTSKLIRFISPSETCWIHKWLTTSILLVLSNRLNIEKGLSVGFQKWVGLKSNGIIIFKVMTSNDYCRILFEYSVKVKSLVLVQLPVHT